MKKAVWMMIALFLCHNFYPLGIAYGKEKKGKGEEVKKEELPYIGVLDLEAKEGVPSSAIAPLSDSLRKELFNTKKFKVLDRKNMHVILKEQGFQQVGCTSSECAVEAGRLLGVEKMVTGNIAKLGDTYYISVTVTNVETGEVESIADEKCRGEIEKLFDAIGKIVGKITGVPPKVAPTPITPEVLKVSGEPVNAQIILDGHILGSSPQEIKIAPGAHKVEITKPGYKSYTTEFQLTKGEGYIVSYKLEKAEEVPEAAAQVSEDREWVPKEDRGFGISLAAPRYVRGDGNILGTGLRFQPRIFSWLWVY
ncbi:MAG: PEGA domain-containing protein, partial [Deltaproteobacteria bacterium]